MKNILESIGMSISHAVDCVVEKNRRSAQINRLKLVIRREERISEKAYIALGKYYYHNLRDENDPVTEPHCAAVDQAARRMDRAITRLEEIFAQPQQEESECASCGYDCSSCQDFCGCEEEPEEACCCETSQEEEACCEGGAKEEEPCCCQEAPAAQEAPVAEEAPVEEPAPVEEEAAPQPPVESTYTGTEEAADPRDNREIPFQ